MSRELRSVRHNWERFGRTDPMWGVLAHAGMEGRWDSASFYEHGVRDVDTLYEEIARTGIDLPGGRALDFGCGAGRLTFALARRFEAVDGVDISEPMLQFARRHQPTDGNCSFHLYDGRRLNFPTGTFDFVLSLTTLQHVPPAAVPGYIAELVRVLRSGGVLALQIPALPVPGGVVVPFRARFRRRLSLIAYRYLARRPVMEMSGIEPAIVHNLFLAAGADAPHPVLDGRAGDWAPSYLYVSTKKLG